MEEKSLSPHLQNRELGQFFRESREKQKFSIPEAAARINDIAYPLNSDDPDYDYLKSAVDAAAKQVRSIENGDFFVDSQHQHRQQELIHQLAQLYGASSLEDEYCSRLCPIGRYRKQLQYDNVKEVTLSLSASMDYLEDHAKPIGRCIRDDYISESEWPDILEMLNILRNISHRSKSIQRWSGFSVQRILDDRPARDVAEKTPNPYAMARKGRQNMTQAAAAAATDIPRATIASIESDRKVPTQGQIVRMSNAYLSPQIRHFYCYRECPINGRQEPLDVQDSKGVICRFLSSLLYVGDLNRQLRRLLADGEIQDGERAEFQDVLNEMMDLSRQADAMVLKTLQHLCDRLKVILADGRVTEDERPEFERIIDYLERLGYPPDHLEELQREYL